MDEEAKKHERELVKSLLMALMHKRHGDKATEMEPVIGCNNVIDGVTSQEVGDGIIEHMLWYNDETGSTRGLAVRTELKAEERENWENIFPEQKIKFKEETNHDYRTNQVDRIFRGTKTDQKPDCD